MSEQWPPRWRGIGRVSDDGLTRLERRWIVRRFSHLQKPWAPCYQLMRGVCVRCWWREVTGKNKRDKATYLEAFRRRAKNTPVTYWRMR